MEEGDTSHRQTPGLQAGTGPSPGAASAGALIPASWPPHLCKHLCPGLPGLWPSVTSARVVKGPKVNALMSVDGRQRD